MAEISNFIELRKVAYKHEYNIQLNRIKADIRKNKEVFKYRSEIAELALAIRESYAKQKVSIIDNEKYAVYELSLLRPMMTANHQEINAILGENKPLTRSITERLSRIVHSIMLISIYISKFDDLYHYGYEHFAVYNTVEMTTATTIRDYKDKINNT